MSQGSQKTQTVTSESNTEPWSAQKPYLQDVFKQAQDLSKTPLQYYPGQQVAPFAPESEAALQATTYRALNGSPVTNAAQGESLRTINGDYLSAGNPYFGQMADRVAGDVMPRVASQFGNAGGPGGLYARALGLGLGDAIGGLAYQNYGDERNRQQAAVANAPNLANVDYQDIAQLGNVGVARQGLAQQNIDAAMNAYNFAQTEPQQRLQNYAGLVTGNYGGTTTGTQTSSVPTPNPWSQALGLGLGAAGIVGQTGGFGPAGWLTRLLK